MPPLDRFLLIQTGDLVELERALATRYNARQLQLSGARRSFSSRVSHLQLGSVGLVFSSCSAGLLISWPADEIVRLHLALEGNAETIVGTTRISLTAGGTAITPAYVGLRQRFDPGFEQVVLRFSEPALRLKLEAILGIDINVPLQFEAVTAARHPDIRMLRNLALDILSSPGAFIPEASPAVQAEIGQTGMVALLYGAHHNYTYLLTADTKEIAPWQVRRAVDYIESNWMNPLRIEDITTAIDASGRSIFKAFKAALQLSPMEYVRAVRLRKARKMLLASTETTVGDVALACGFQNPGHFARNYREAFGELPSLTLARTRTSGRAPRRGLELAAGDRHRDGAIHRAAC